MCETGKSLLLADEAIFDAEGADGSSWPSGDQPDWARSAVFVMARFQFDQMYRILEGIVGEDAPGWSRTSLSDRLRRRWREAGLDSGEIEFELDMFEDALDIRRHLPGGIVAATGWAVDGSVSFERGPELPGSDVFNLEETRGELIYTPARIFDIARDCTIEAAKLAVRLTRAEEARDR